MINLLCVDNTDCVNVVTGEADVTLVVGNVYSGHGPFASRHIPGEYVYSIHELGGRNCWSGFFIELPSDEEITAEEEGAELDQAFRDNNLDAGSIKTMTL